MNIDVVVTSSTVLKPMKCNEYLEAILDGLLCVKSEEQCGKQGNCRSLPTFAFNCKSVLEVITAGSTSMTRLEESNIAAC